MNEQDPERKKLIIDFLNDCDHSEKKHTVILEKDRKKAIDALANYGLP